MKANQSRKSHQRPQKYQSQALRTPNFSLKSYLREQPDSLEASDSFLGARHYTEDARPKYAS